MLSLETTCFSSQGRALLMASALLCAAVDTSAQASAVAGASALRLLPAVPSLTQIEAATRSAGTALPAGYVEKSLVVRPGPITYAEFDLLAKTWGYMVVDCGLSGILIRYRNACTDGVDPTFFYPTSRSGYNPCGGQRWDRVYSVLVPSGGSTYVDYFTCSMPKTYTTIYKLTAH